MPIETETNLFFSIGVKIACFFLSFVGGIVTATWVVAGKVKGFEDRLVAVETAQLNCQKNTLGNIDKKLDRIHERIDDILLMNGKE